MQLGEREHKIIVQNLPIALIVFYIDFFFKLCLMDDHFLERIIVHTEVSLGQAVVMFGSILS